MAIGHLAKYAFKRAKTEVPLIDLRKASSYNIEELNQIRRKLAKRANQRLRDLERAGYTSSYVYKTVMSSYLTPSNRIRFHEGTRKLDLFALKTELEELRWFLEAKTSTVGGVRSFERKTRKAFERIGVSKEEDFWTFLSSETFKHLSNFYSSEEMIEFYDFAKENSVSHEDIMKALEAFRSNEIEAWDELYERVGLNFFEKVSRY